MPGYVTGLSARSHALDDHHHTITRHPCRSRRPGLLRIAAAGHNGCAQLPPAAPRDGGVESPFPSHARFGRRPTLVFHIGPQSPRAPHHAVLRSIAALPHIKLRSIVARVSHRERGALAPSQLSPSRAMYQGSTTAIGAPPTLCSPPALHLPSHCLLTNGAATHLPGLTGDCAATQPALKAEGLDARRATSAPSLSLVCNFTLMLNLL
ncbi:hypothetical protein BS50DRAFT_407624 [Corynespora cassiicola Philippines]|uniref:Uncharacterized protein n=1 Tax=Corynespora cassiicola Philippines TaxID=1448308 RepID=A0A2T2NL33_CORCC|nr:hypothetical protein BS50DRAFT_407624 [Corynespora cassiicola Philippines]